MSIKMKQKRMGNTGLMVSELCLGCMTFGENKMGIPTTTEEESFRMMDRFAEVGGNFLDTADIYGPFCSEEVVGRWLQTKNRDDFIVATKVRGRIGTGPNDLGLSRKHIMQGIEGSLSRLQTSYIDLYQVHYYDIDTPLEETLSTLNDLVRSGKVRYIGVSNFCGWQLQKANAIAKELGLEKFMCLQPQYSLLCRSTEWDLIPCAKDLGMGVIPWSPLAGGWLSGKFTRELTAPIEGSRVAWAQKVGWKPTGWDFLATEKTWQIIDTLQEIAAETNMTVAQVALRWLMQKDGVTCPIVGAKSVTQLEDNLGACTFELTSEQMARLDEKSSTSPPYPFDQFWNFTRDR